MGVEVFITGIIIGMMASIPLGPIGVMCIQRTLSKNHKSGFVSGLGAATADLLFAMIAFFSLSFVTSFIQQNIDVVKVIGGICVVAVGMKIFMTNPVVQIRKNRAGKSNLWQDFLSLFLITLANPTFILIYVALFAAFGISKEATQGWNTIVMVLGVFAGGALWWFTLTFIVNLFRNKFRPRHLLWINRIAGAVIVVLGAATIMLIFFKTPVDGVLG